jgi:protein phosphatase
VTKFAWQSAGLTSRGLVRKDNQDSYYISTDGRAFVVADGVGGYGGGATASRLAVETVEEGWNQGADLDGEQVETWMRETVTQANRRIIAAAQTDAALENMGTTIVMAVIDKSGNLHVGHAGDSRAVRIRKEEFKMLTIDHSMVMEMHIAGQLTLEQARNNIYKHLITRCLGHDEDVEIDYSQTEFLPGDCIVLASDGLSDEMAEDEISAAVQGCFEAQEVCKKLMDTVLERGARDNTTIVAVVRIPSVSPTAS